ncbi:protein STRICTOSIDINE SYNTHASE-LIKE 7-like [Coffea eugenioides]|uniref:protein STRICTOSIDINE SYNTHASE-LIKE 7-like n=1 Tax=Coffea eugenioides TaxID=49369 RepID=UPI000F60841E|nr:protein STRICTOSIDINE SYNTHASE-LIKE 7-like [Coffea eugenioides]
MAESTRIPSPSSSGGTSGERTKKSRWPFACLVSVLPVVVGVLVYQLDSFDPAPYPAHELTQKKPLIVPKSNPHMLKGAENIGVGKLLGPEDIAYDPKSGVIYTGCEDGWIKRVTVNDSAADSVVADWINTGGRPLGVVCGHHGEVIVADADKGLLNATADGVIQLLTDEAEGVKFRLTDGVDVAEDGIVYFTDASYKYSYWEFAWDYFEGRPFGRLLSYDPSTKETKVLVRDLYFANGVAVSPDQKFVIFCESPMARCKKYYINGERKGSVDIFVENLPGMPDNIRYDGQGHYWIALPTEITYAWDLAQRYPFIRKIMAIMDRHVGRPHVEKNGGGLAVDLDGKPAAHYYERGLSLITGVNKIGDHIYLGSIDKPYIIRLNIKQYPAVSDTEYMRSLILDSTDETL